MHLKIKINHNTTAPKPSPPPLCKHFLNIPQSVRFLPNCLLCESSFNLSTENPFSDLSYQSHIRLTFFLQCFRPNPPQSCFNYTTLPRMFPKPPNVDPQHGQIRYLFLLPGFFVYNDSSPIINDLHACRTLRYKPSLDTTHLLS